MGLSACTDDVPSIPIYQTTHTFVYQSNHINNITGNCIDNYEGWDVKHPQKYIATTPNITHNHNRSECKCDNCGEDKQNWHVVMKHARQTPTSVRIIAALV